MTRLAVISEQLSVISYQESVVQTNVWQPSKL